MLKSTLRLLFFSLSGLLALELSPFLNSPVKGSKYYQDSSFTSKKIHVKNKVIFGSNLNEFKKSIKKDLINSENKFLNFLALNNKSIISSLEIESDIQYQENNIFYAEGNAVLYFSNGSLKGDKVKYDKEKKQITVQGNVIFAKGRQSFEASKVFFDFNENFGSIDDIYGVLNIESISSDFELLSVENEELVIKESIQEIEDLRKISSLSLGLVNKLEEKNKLNITNLNLSVPSINVWRFKSDRITFEENFLKSKKIFFTNDALNKPQFLIRSKNFTAEIVEDKPKIISRNTLLILDDKLSFPIGKRTLFDKDPLTKLGLGSDYGEKDGFYVSRGFDVVKISNSFDLKLQPYFLIQRALMGYSNSFRAPDSSILSPKVKNDIDLTDNFALDADLNGKFNLWDINLNTSLSSFNLDRLQEATRSKLTLRRIFDLNAKDRLYKKESNLNNTNDEKILDLEDFNLTKKYDLDLSGKNEILEKESFSNFIDLKFFSSYREKVNRGFSGEHEIYFGNGLSVENKKTWKVDNRETNLTTLFNIGEYKAKLKDTNLHKTLLRNVLAAKYSYKFPLWVNNKLDKNINTSYKYSSEVIKQRIDWINTIQAGIFFYSDDSNQKAITLNTGPTIVLGSFKNNFLDYTSLDLKTTYVIGEGESPFAFDNIDESFRINFKFDQQIYGALVFSYENGYNLDNGKFDKGNYGLDFKRRAYSIGAFYNKNDESLGFRFNIFNFDYSGLSPKF